jgi:hypothetical protein
MHSAQRAVENNLYKPKYKNYLPKSSCNLTISSSSEGLLGPVCCQISTTICLEFNPVNEFLSPLV